MRDALTVFWRAVRDWYNGMVSFAAMNALWFGAALTIVLLGPATAGLYAVTYSAARGTGQHISDFWQGAREYLWISLRWLLLNVIIVIVFAVNVWFYGSAPGLLGQIVLIVLITLGLLWITMQLYLWPFLVLQEEPKLRTALKNALFLALATPVYTLTLLSCALAALIFSIVLIAPLALFLTSFLALLGSLAVRERLQTFGKLPSPVPTPIDGEPL